VSCTACKGSGLLTDENGVQQDEPCHDCIGTGLRGGGERAMRRVELVALFCMGLSASALFMAGAYSLILLTLGATR
jgi:hypothetical protein